MFVAIRRRGGAGRLPCADGHFADTRARGLRAGDGEQAAAWSDQTIEALAGELGAAATQPRTVELKVVGERGQPAGHRRRSDHRVRGGMP